MDNVEKLIFVVLKYQENILTLTVYSKEKRLVFLKFLLRRTNRVRWKENANKFSIPNGDNAK